MKKRKAKEIIGKPIKEYRLPLIERLAYYRPFLKWLFWTIIAAAIIIPTIAVNYENLLYFIFISPIVALFIVSLISFIRFWIMSSKYRSIILEEAESDSAYENFMGPPGSGKSYAAKELINAKAFYSWEEISFEYWMIAPKLRDPEYNPTEEEKEIIEAYEFFSKNEGIPCFGSNIPCYSKRYKRYSYVVDKEHLRQEKRLAFRTCMLWDEIGTACNHATSKAVYSNSEGATNIDDLARYIRQFGEFRMIGTEQDANNIAIFLRRVANDNKRFDRKQWVLKPRFLFWIYMLLKRHFIKKMRMSESIMFSKFMRNFKKYIFSCGFFKFTFTSCGNLETQGRTEKIVVVMKQKSTCYYFPRASEVVYDTRAFRRAYLPLDKPIVMQVYRNIKLTREQAKTMLKSENLSKKEGQKK